MEKKTALITGATRGIGRAIALELAKEFHVILNSRSENDALFSLQDEIKSSGGTSEGLLFDVSSKTSIEDAFKTLKGRNLDVLVNNAGITKDGLLLRLKEEDLMQLFQTNLFGAMWTTKEAVTLMLKQKIQGSIINIGSVVAQMGNPGQSTYCAAKAALEGFTRSNAKEFGARQIRFNTIAPGFIQTEMTENLDSSPILQNIALQSFGQPQDVAECVRFLASPRSKYITGQVIGVNGGLWF